MIECARDIDCALQNVEHGFGCCFDGACDQIDYSHDSWRPVNREWWQSEHDACSVNCGPAYVFFPFIFIIGKWFIYSIIIN